MNDDLPPDVELEAPFSEQELTPTVRVCPDCTAEQTILDDRIGAPLTPVEAWRLMTCRGTRNRDLWRWCRKFGEVTRPRAGTVTSFDRRRIPR